MAERLAPILEESQTPESYDSEFETLQNSYSKWWDDYGFDGYSTWARGCERATRLLEVPTLRRPNLDVFETGCGDGMTAHVLESYGHQVTLNDAADWRDDRARTLPFVQGDICGRLPLKNESFDLLISYNAFEHIQDPRSGLAELVRLCKTDGHIYIEFNPLYCSALGLHAFSFFMPYPQFLFSPSLIDSKIRELGANDLGQNLPYLQPTNKRRLAEFRELWHSSGCTIVSLVEEVDPRHLGIVLKYPGAFSGRNLTVEDLSVSAVKVLLKKAQK